MLNEVLNIFCNNVIPCVINSFVVVYLLSKIMNIKLDFKDKKVYLVVAFLASTAIFIFFFVDDFVRIIASTISIGIANYLLFHQEVNKTILGTIIEQIILLIGEILFVVVLILTVSSDRQFLMNNYYGEIITVLAISLLAVFAVNFKPIIKIYRKAMNSLDRVNDKYIIISIALFAVVVNILLFFVFHGANLLSILFLNLLFMFTYGFILYRGLLDKSNAIMVGVENKALAENLDEYEKMLNYQRVSNHENKNQLLVIRSMLNDKDVQAIEYINEIINDKKQDDEVLFNSARKIPSGGLQGIIYQKMLVMNDKKIKASLDVSNSLKKIKFDKIKPKLNYDICRIVGVFLDNAIEEVSNNVEKEICISLYVENKDLIIDIANQFSNAPDLSMIGEAGFTTKGKSRGHGLSLVKKIVEENDYLENERKISGNVFIQTLKIKM